MKKKHSKVKPIKSLKSIEEVSLKYKVSKSFIKKLINKHYPYYIQGNCPIFLSEKMIKVMLPEISAFKIMKERRFNKKAVEVLEWLQEKARLLEFDIEEIDNSEKIPIGFNVPYGCIQLNSVAKILDLGFGRNKLCEILRDQQILMTKINHNEPFQKFVDRGYFYLIPTKDRIQNIWYTTTYVSPKGLVWLEKFLKKLLSLSKWKQKKLELKCLEKPKHPKKEFLKDLLRPNSRQLKINLYNREV